MSDPFDEAFNDDAPSEDVPSSVEEKEPPTTSEEVEAGSPEEPPADESGVELAAPDEPAPVVEEPVTQPGLDQETFKAILDEREKRQKFEAENEDLKRRLQQFENKPEPKTPVQFDWDKPEEAFQSLERQGQQAMLQQKVQQSQFFAAREFGEDVVQQADEWTAKQPDHIRRALAQQPSPYHAAVDAMKKDQATSQLAEYGFDIEKLVEARIAALETPPAEPAVPAPTEKPVVPPKVLGAGGRDTSAVPPTGSVFDEVFER